MSLLYELDNRDYLAWGKFPCISIHCYGRATMVSSSERFTNRVGDYVRYRPDYPIAATDELSAELSLASGMTVADIGAGTGLLTLSLMRTGANVIAIDPNEDMLAAAREYLAGHDNVRIIVGSAEETSLSEQSLDAITAGQAFHWFDHARAREEFLRVLKPGGMVALVWNAKAFGTSPFLAGYERILDERVPEFAEVRHETSGDAEIAEFYGSEPTVYSFPHEQRFNWDGVLGRAMSSSYTPKPGHSNHESFVTALRNLFHEHAEDDTIAWPYTTMFYVGTLTT